MSRIRVILFCLAAAFCLSSCAGKMDEPVVPFRDRGIVIDFSSVGTKATAADLDYESRVSHLDILVFSADGSLYWHERTSVTSSEGSHTLSVGTGHFAGKDAYGNVVSHPSYNVYVVANCTFDMEFSAENKVLAVSGTGSDGAAVQYAVSDLSAFGSIIQEDLNLHMSGLNLPLAPSCFLMDAVAKADGNPDVKLSSENSEDNIVLTAALSRAASKVVINIREGKAVEFTEGADLLTKGLFDASEHGLYYIRNLPYKTTLLPVSHVNDPEDLTTTIKTNNAHFTWNPVDFSTDTTQVKPDAGERDLVTITTYVYEHSWEDKSLFEYEPCVVVNLPLIFVEGEGHYHAHANSWYKIPLAKGTSFGRNKLYKVNVEINYAGATTVMEPVVVPDISYEVAGYEDEGVGWHTEEINVSQSDRPRYLTISRETVDMHNETVDNTIRFSSSSDVTVTIDRVYYHNKYGEEVEVDPADSILVSAPSGLIGNITVESPMPVNNAPRYIRVKVSNPEAEDKYFLVTQYPLEYITNTQGYYSYREDFGGTTYEGYDSRRYVSVGGWNQSDLSWKTYSSSTNYFNGCLFQSKVATQKADGTSSISYYAWTRNLWNYRLTTTSPVATLINARMYHIKLASSSSSYSVGIPKMDSNGWTDSGQDNKKLVSPSFMIASQLGATYPPSYMEQAASHCANYVETYKDEAGNVIHLSDWRLPTEAEIQIIIDFQYRENAAMDEVLAGRYYWSATGQVENPQSRDDDSTSAVRCVRNAF